jgi:mannose-6-phosphate isomerase-like protein (cupin superfamily)
VGATIFPATETLVRLDAAGFAASPLPRSPEAWREINRARGERVVGMATPVDPTDLHPDTWEMHPDGDEVLFLLDGAIDVALAGDGETQTDLLSLASGQGCVVEPGTWHRLLLREPSRLLFVTPAGGTRMRPWRDVS